MTTVAESGTLTSNGFGTLTNLRADYSENIPTVRIGTPTSVQVIADITNIAYLCFVHVDSWEYVPGQRYIVNKWVTVSLGTGPQGKGLVSTLTLPPTADHPDSPYTVDFSLNGANLEIQGPPGVDSRIAIRTSAIYSSR
jgi:hypothetical protein